MMNAFSNLTNKLQKNKSPKVLVALVLGQASLDCRRFGICKMKPIEEEEQLLEMAFDCLAYLSLEEEELLGMEILHEWMTDPIYQRFFAEKVFCIGEDFRLPSSVRQVLGIKTGLSILAGSYPINNGIITFYPQQEQAA